MAKSWLDWVVNTPLLEGVYQASTKASQKVSGFTSGATYQNNKSWWIAGGVAAAALGVVAVAMATGTGGVIDRERDELGKALRRREEALRRQLEDAYALACRRGDKKSIEIIMARVREQDDRLAREAAREAARAAGQAEEFPRRIEVGSPTFAAHVVEFEALQAAMAEETREAEARLAEARRARMASLGAGPGAQTYGAQRQDELIAEARAATEAVKKSREREDALRMQALREKAAMAEYERQVAEATKRGRRPPPMPEFTTKGKIDEMLRASCQRIEEMRLAEERRIARESTPEARRARMAAKDEAEAAHARELQAAVEAGRRRALATRGGGERGHVKTAQQLAREARAEVAARLAAEEATKAAFGLEGKRAPEVSAEVFVVRRRS